MRMSIVGAALLATVALADANGAFAAPCAGFTDVQDTSPFCKNVEWLKNRSITLGCASGLYCPSDPVSRLTMAAFMNRLGSVLTPAQLWVDNAPGAIDLDLNPVVCQTGDFAVAGYPRRAYVDATLAATSAGDVDVAAAIVSSSDGGATWVPLNVAQSLVSVFANRWSASSDVAYRDLNVGQNVRFGLRVARTGASAADLSDSRCNLRSLIVSRDGAASPF